MRRLPKVLGELSAGEKFLTYGLHGVKNAPVSLSVAWTLVLPSELT